MFSDTFLPGSGFGFVTRFVSGSGFVLLYSNFILHRGDTHIVIKKTSTDKTTLEIIYNSTDYD
jgi:hypothetical protein